MLQIRDVTSESLDLLGVMYGDILQYIYPTNATIQRWPERYYRLQHRLASASMKPHIWAGPPSNNYSNQRGLMYSLFDGQLSSQFVSDFPTFYPLFFYHGPTSPQHVPLPFSENMIDGPVPWMLIILSHIFSLFKAPQMTALRWPRIIESLPFYFCSMRIVSFLLTLEKLIAITEKLHFTLLAKNFRKDQY